MKRYWKKIFYPLYIIFVAIFFLYLLFPANRIKEYAEYKINQIDPFFYASIHDLKLCVPFDINFYKIDVFRLNNLFISIDKTQIHPVLTSIFRSEKKFKIFCDLYNGNIKGEIKLQKNMSFSKLDMNLSKIHITNLPSYFFDYNMDQEKDYDLSGFLNGKIDSNFDQKGNISTKGQFNIIDSDISFLNPIFLIKKLSFKSINGKFNFKNNRLVLKSLEIQGNEASGSIYGSIVINAKQVQKSSLKLRGTIKLHALFMSQIEKVFPVLKIIRGKILQKGIKFKINGTFEKPSFQMVKN